MNMERPIDTGAGGELGGEGRRHPWAYRITAALIVVALALAYLLLHRPAPAPALPAPPTLTVATPLVRKVVEWDDYVGRFAPSRSVEVRPLVSGRITAIHFTDGAPITKGQLLFTIDPRPFTAALAEAQARLASARSDLALAQANLARGQRLIADDAVSKSDLDALAARVQASNAAVAAALAQVRARALDVEFAQVRAPISGQISDRRADAGNIVSASQAGGGTLLTTINALDPIYFSFTGSEALYLKAKRAQEAGAAASSVEIRLQDEEQYRWKGRIDFTDNELDPRSGTIRARAVIANPARFLAPGMFGNMRLQTGEQSIALLVPDTAIVTDQARKTALIVAADGTVIAKPVTLGPLVNGLRIVRAGLDKADRVIIAGVQFARPGDKAQIRQGRILPADTADAGPPAHQVLTGEATFSR